jgi:hypothetical protein
MKSPRPRLPRAVARGRIRVDVLVVVDEHTVLVRAGASPAEAIVPAAIAVPGYVPAVGDRVVVERDEEGWLVLGVLGPARLRQASFGLVATPLPNGGVELRAPAGDLTFAASGTIALCSGEIALRAGEVVTAAERVETVAAEVVTRAGRIAIDAERVVEHAGDTYRRADGLAELQAGRARTLVDGACQIVAGRTSITSNEDTVVDGARVLLG